MKLRLTLKEIYGDRMRKPSRALYDPWLLITSLGLFSLGLVMVASASVSIAEAKKLSPLYFAIHHAIAGGLGLIALFVISYIPMRFWQKISFSLLLICIVLLGLVLIPGLSREINGSTRWLFLGPFSMQPSEFIKLSLIFSMASYLSRRHEEVQRKLSGFLKPMSLLTIVGGLLLLEPDFGTAVVLTITVMCMLYLGGVPFTRFLFLFALALFAAVALSLTSPYRLARLTTFLNPWADQFNTGYQLTQSLIAFGRGGILGTGLGNSVQKLFYLPEAYTDFLYAVLAEELGLLGALLVLIAFSLFVWRTLNLGQRAIQAGLPFAGFVAYGIAVWIGVQASINMGVNLGLLPTKGLTLPLMSYGGSSLIVALAALGILLRIDFETRMRNILP